MPLTNTYQKYLNDGVFGIISNDSVSVKYVKDKAGKSGRNCIAGSGSSVAIWNIRSSQPDGFLLRESGIKPVSAIAFSSGTNNSDTLVAVGYMDGWVNVFSLWSQKTELNFRAARHRVTSIDIVESTIVCAAESELHVLDIIAGGGYRLKGHRGAITAVKLLQKHEILISGGRDTFIKLWCLRTQHCFLTLTGHPGPVWDFTMSADRKTLVSGSSDSNLRLWKLKYKHSQQKDVNRETDHLNITGQETIPKLAEAVLLSDYNSIVDVDFHGCIQRKSLRRVFSLNFDPSGQYLACQTLDKTLEIYVLLSEAEKVSRLRKKQKKARKLGIEDSLSVKLTAEDELRCMFRVVLPMKLSSCDLRITRFNFKRRPRETEDCAPTTILHVLCSYRTNLVEEYDLKVPEIMPNKPIILHAGQILNSESIYDNPQTIFKLSNRVSNPGHRSYPIRCQLTEDALGIFTLARGEGKLWNRSNFTCLATLDWSTVGTNETNKTKIKSEEEDIVMEENTFDRSTAAAEKLKASAFVLAPGSRHVVIGFESGILCLFDLLSKIATQTITNAQIGAVRSLILTGDRKGVISGGSNKQISFWNFDLSLVSGGGPRLCLKTIRPSEVVPDQVTALAATFDNRLIAVAMVNLHVDIFFSDSFKRVHSLYGMSAPVTCMDMSGDSRLLMTGSGDKTVRLWELQFGNCLRRFTEHIEPISSVCFLPTTNLAFSCDLGGIIKQWDVKRMHEICTLQGHEGGVTCLSAIATRPGLGKKSKEAEMASKKHGTPKRKTGDDNIEGVEDDDIGADVCGGLLASTGRDFSCRLWMESEEILVVEEEAELAREAAEDEAELVRSEVVIPGAVAPEAAETGALGRPTVTTRNAADELMEAIDIYRIAEAAPSEPPHPLMASYKTSDPDRFLFAVFSSLRLPGSGGVSGLEHALGTVHGDHVTRFLPVLAKWAERGWDLELVGRAIRFLCTLHVGMVTTEPRLIEALATSQKARQLHLANTRKMIGVNLAALDFLKQKIEEDQPVVLFQEATNQRAKRTKKMKERLAKQVAIATA